MPTNPITKWSTGERFNEDVGNRPLEEMVSNNQEIISQNRDLVNRLSMKPLYDFRFDENRYFVDGVETDLSSITTYTRPAIDFIKTPSGRYVLNTSNTPSFPYADDKRGIFVPATGYDQVDNSDNTSTNVSGAVVSSTTGEQFVEGIDVVRFTEDGSYNETSGVTGNTHVGYGSYTVSAGDWGTAVIIIKPSDNLNFVRVTLSGMVAYIIDTNTLEIVNIEGDANIEYVSFSFIDDGFIECRIVTHATSEHTFNVIVNMSDENHTYNATVPDGAYIDVAYFGVMNGGCAIPTYNNTGATQSTSRGNFSLIPLTDFDLKNCAMMVEYYDRIGEGSGLVSLRSSGNSSHLYVGNTHTGLRVDGTPTSYPTHSNINANGLNSIIATTSNGVVTTVINGFPDDTKLTLPTFTNTPDNLEICGNGYGSYGGYIKRIAIFDKALPIDTAIALTKGTE